MNKKAQGLSLNVIIIAALALIVLIVLVAIFTGQIGGFGKGTATVKSQAFSCETLCNAQGYAEWDFEPEPEDCTGRVLPQKVKDNDGEDTYCCCILS